MVCAMLSPEDEQARIQAARNGDLEAFNCLVLAYQDQVYRLAYRLLGDVETAADVAQETFLAAFQHLEGFRQGSLRAWLLRITTNLAYDALRRLRTRRTWPLSALLTGSDSPVQYAGGAEHDPEAYAERRELADEIQKGLATLPPEQRAALILCDIESVPYAEAAHALGLSLGTLKSRLFRGRARLREYFLERRELLPISLRSIFEPHWPQRPTAVRPKDPTDEPA